MAFVSLLVDDAGGVRTLTVNRPEKLNALSSGVIAELDSALTEAKSDPAVRAVIVTGAGEKAFVAGADISELAKLKAHGAKELSRRGQRVFRKLETLGKPSVAAISGFALGGGLELAMACSVRFASPNAKLGQPEVKLGLPPGYGGTQRLPRLVGRGLALEMLLSGEPVDAERALAIGLVNRVVPQPELLGAAREWLGKVMANGPVAVALTLDAVDTGLNVGIEEGLRYEAAAFGLACATEDFGEGTRAFLEKRRAAFAGR